MLLCPRWMKQNNASRLCEVFFLYEMWAWCSVHVLAAPKAAQTLHDDLSVMVEEGDEKEEERQESRGEKMKWATQGAIKRQALGPGNRQPREAAVRAGCQTQQCPAEDSSLCAKHCSAALVPKQTNQPAPATLPTLSLREGIYFSNSEGKGFYSSAWSHFLNPKFSICGLGTGRAMGTTARTYVNDKSHKKRKLSGGHLHMSEGGTQENNWICKNSTGVLLPLFFAFSRSSSLSSSLPYSLSLQREPVLAYTAHCLRTGGWWVLNSFLRGTIELWLYRGHAGSLKARLAKSKWRQGSDMNSGWQSIHRNKCSSCLFKGDP